MSPQMLISLLVIFLAASEAVPAFSIEREARSVNDPADQVKRDNAAKETKKVIITDNRLEVEITSGGKRTNGSQILGELNSLQQTVQKLVKEKFKAKDFSLLFPKKGVTDYVLVRRMTSLRAVTGCLWMLSSDQVNEGTPFSYAISGSYNELLLYNYKNFALWVGNRAASYSGVSANDGRWHHICFTWENTAGSWQIYKDGSRKANGAGLKKGHVIRAGGALILGQEQGSVGGRFHSSISFVGSMSQVNLWNHVLTAQEISKLSKSCHTAEGNVFKWSDIRSGYHGAVELIQPSSCKP